MLVLPVDFHSSQTYYIYHCNAVKMMSEVELVYHWLLQVSCHLCPGGIFSQIYEDKSLQFALCI